MDLNSHEAPLSVLRHIRDQQLPMNYDYALVHLFDSPKIGEEYFRYFKESSDMGRPVFLDNSIFELGVSFEPGKFASYVELLQPTVYIVPDVLEDAEQTMEQFEQFVKNHPNLPGLKMGVVQGRTYDELKECYMFMAANADYIAISYDYSYYNEHRYWAAGNIQLERAAGRVGLVRQLIADGVFALGKPHHLLGSSMDHEFKYYKGIPAIHSVDTSNPVWAGLNNLGGQYLEGWGMVNDKPYDSSKIKMCELIEQDYQASPEELERIENCIFSFWELLQ